MTIGGGVTEYRGSSQSSSRDQAGGLKQAEPTVFVVDDDLAMRDSLRWLLQSAGLPVETHGTAEQFLDAYDPARPGCLVLDMRLPGMNGLSLQVELHNRRIQLPVIVITGYGDATTRARAFKAGAVDFVEKPFDDEVLLDRIRRAIAADRQARSR